MTEQALVQEVQETLQPNRDWTPEQRRVIAAIVVLQECTFAEAAKALRDEMNRELEHGYNNGWWSPHILSCWANSAGYRVQSAREARQQRFHLLKGGAK